MYESIIRRIECEAWTVPKWVQLQIFEYKILGIIFEPIQNRSRMWRIRSNCKPWFKVPHQSLKRVKSYKKPKNWLSVIRDVHRWSKKCLVRYLSGSQWAGSIEGDQEENDDDDDIEEDLQRLTIWGWRSICKERTDERDSLNVILGNHFGFNE